MFVTRRSALAALGLGLAGCTINQQQAQMTLDQVKSYVASFVNMVDSAAQVYLASAVAKDKQIVEKVMAQLQSAAQAVQNATAPADVKSTLIQIVQFVQEIEPDVAPFLGPDAPFIALGLSVLQAAINAIPVQPTPTSAQMNATVSRLKAAHPGVFRN